MELSHPPCGWCTGSSKRCTAEAGAGTLDTAQGRRSAHDPASWEMDTSGKPLKPHQLVSRIQWLHAPRGCFVMVGLQEDNSGLLDMLFSLLGSGVQAVTLYRLEDFRLYLLFSLWHCSRSSFRLFLGLPLLGRSSLRFPYGPCFLRFWFLPKGSNLLELFIILFHFFADIVAPDRERNSCQQSETKGSCNLGQDKHFRCREAKGSFIRKGSMIWPHKGLYSFEGCFVTRMWVWPRCLQKKTGCGPYRAD